MLHVYIGRMTRWLLVNAHHEGLRVSGSLHVSAKTSDTRQAGGKFTQVRGPRRGNTRTSCLSDLVIDVEVDYNGAADGLHGWISLKAR